MNLRTSIRKYYIVHFLKNFAYAVPLSILFLFILERGFNLQDIGIIFGTLAATIVLLEIPTGGLADTIGRKRTSIYGYVINALAICLLIVATNLSLALAYAVLAGLGRTFSSGSLDAWFLDQIKEANPDEDLQPYLARADLFELLANMGGAFLGGLLPFLFLYYFPSSTLEPLVIPFIASLFLRGFALYALITLIPNDSRNKNAHLQPLANVKKILKDATSIVNKSSDLRKLLFLTFVNGLALGSFDTFWQPYFKTSLNISSENTLAYGSILAVGFLFGTLGSLISTRYVDWFQTHGQAALSLQLVKASVFIVLAVTTNLYITLVAFVIFYVALVAGLSPHGALYNHTIPNNLRSSLMSTAGLMFFLGAGLGASFVGYLANNISFSVAFLCVAIITTISAFFYAGLKIPKVTEMPKA